MRRLITVLPIVIGLLAGTFFSCSWNNPYATGYLSAPTVTPTPTDSPTSSNTATPTPTIDLTPPAEVTGLTAVGQDSQVALSWTEPADADFSYVEISGAGFTTFTVPKGTASITVTGLTNYTPYTFLVKTVDTTGNKSAGVSASATPTDRWVESPLNPLFGGSTSGTNRAYYPCVVKAGSTYHIWYGDGLTTRHATSTFADLHDISHPAPIITVGGIPILTAFPGGSGIYHPSVCYNAAGWTINGISTADPFVLYIAQNLNNFMRVLHSADGSDWTEFTVGGACTGLAAGTYNLSVLYEGGTDWKAYSDDGSPNIYYYTSTDGYTWTTQATNFLGTYQAWESATWKRLVPRIIKFGSVYYLFYSSGLTGNDQAIGKAVSNDGFTFTKDVNNPVLSNNDGVVWRANRTYTAWVIWDTDHWRMYFTGRSVAGVYSVGTAVKYGGL